jgi:adenine-specific DNA-methyltransferase
MMKCLQKVFGIILIGFLKNNMAKSRYDNYTKEQLLEKIKQLEKVKYGLVWEDNQENVVEQCDNELPVLHEDPLREIKSKDGLPQNILIEGDNYHALYALNFTHKKKIDVIYIDPPYNTGAKDWKYNNDYVDINDRWRHSKWICMMNHRLRLAKHLLKKNGVLIVTIDDNESCSLGLLLERIFPCKERATIVIKYNPAGTARNGFSRNHEYAYFLLNPGQEIEKKPAPRDVRDQNLRRHGNGANRQDSPTMFFPIYIDKKTLSIMGAGDVPKDNFHPIQQTKDCGAFYEVWPLDNHNKEKRWYFGKERVHTKGNEELVCKWMKDKLHVYFHTDNLSEQKYQSVWVGSEYDSGAHGGSMVRDIVGKQFPFPKSLYAVKDCLNAIVRNNKEAIILDFFAGSGTTGHAVLSLNAEDGGERQFILCTNNENNICEEITYPRIKKVIKGCNGNKPIPANLKYYKTDFVPQVITDNDKRILVNRSTELLCLAENTFELVKQSKRKLEFAIYRNKKQLTAIIYDEDAIGKCKEQLESLKPKENIVIYVFSYDHEYNIEDFDDLTINYDIKPIPEAILNVYRRNARLKRR